MFGWEFPPHITGGLGTACYGITKSLAKQNVNILFVVPRAYGNEDRRYATLQDAAGIPSRYTGSSARNYWKAVLYKEVKANLFPYSSPGIKEEMTEHNTLKSRTEENNENSGFIPFSGKYGTDLWNEIERYTAVTSILAAKENFDIIHAHEWLTFPAAIAAKKISAKPLVVHIHATEFDRNGRNVNGNIYDIEKKGLEVSDKIITVSNYTRDMIIKRYGIPPAKVVTVHNGVDRNAYCKNSEQQVHSNEKVVTFLGRITFQKGPEYFLEAAYMVLQKQGNVRFVMAGSGDLKDKIARRAEVLGISSKVTFPGFLKSDEIRKLFSRTDLYVMPSVSEPFGISTLEALQSGIPVIISKQSGVSEVIRNAIKVDYWDIHALADAVYGVLNYKSLAKILSSKGCKEVEKLHWQKTGSQILNVYKSLV